jgi:hypothetical protein
MYEPSVVENLFTLRGTLNYLLEVKTILDEIMDDLDDRTKTIHQVLERACPKLQRLADHQRSLPAELSLRLSILLTHLRGQAWRRHPEACVAEIKRFYGALLAAIQQPMHCKTI